MTYNKCLEFFNRYFRAFYSYNWRTGTLTAFLLLEELIEAQKDPISVWTIYSSGDSTFL